MHQFISSVALVIADYDEAIDFYVNKLGFHLCEDKQLGADKRWVTVAPPGSDLMSCRILLAKAASAEQNHAVGNQTGGRVFLFLTTDNFNRDYDRLTSVGVRFCEAPRNEPYGRVAVFEDLYGNRWDLIEPKEPK